MFIGDIFVRVSIPFIAGQWSLPWNPRGPSGSRTKFQSPSLRGSGRFPDSEEDRKGRVWFQSPSLRGSGRFGRGAPSMMGPRRVSIPFIAGQWSLRGGKEKKWKRLFSFQSPSLRGSGRFHRGCGARRHRCARFNPLHCGAVVASINPVRARRIEHQVSIPFIAGQWSLPRRMAEGQGG